MPGGKKASMTTKELKSHVAFAPATQNLKFFCFEWPPPSFTLFCQCPCWHQLYFAFLSTFIRRAFFFRGSVWIFLGGSWFDAFLFLWFFAFLLLCFYVSLLFCFVVSLFFVFPASLLFLLLSFFVFPASLLFCFSVFPASLLPCFLFLLPLCFSFSFAWFYSVCILTETLETP